jgi:hypothetical protein
MVIASAKCLKEFLLKKKNYHECGGWGDAQLIEQTFLARDFYLFYVKKEEKVFLRRVSVKF